MDEAGRERRVAELRVLQFNDPRGLIEQYCRLVGVSPGSQMPPGASFSRMIETIIDHEVATDPSHDLTT